MSSKFLFFHIILALAVQLGAGGALPSLEFINAVNDEQRIDLTIKADGILRGSAQLEPGKGYQLSVKKVDQIYYASAALGSAKFLAFHAYEPARDKSRAAVYWKGDDNGFFISYDKIKWVKMADWETE